MAATPEGGPSVSTPEAVATRLGRSLTTDEITQATALLGDVRILIEARIPDLEDRLADETLDPAKLAMVEANSVARLIRNPQGYTGETDGDYTYQVNWKLATGELTITDQEWALLGFSSSVWTVAVRPRTPFERRRALPDVHPFHYGG